MQKIIKYFFVFTFLVAGLISMSPTYSGASDGITINNPTDQVNQYGEIITFQTDVPVRENEKLVVFIKDPLNQWWPWLQTKQVSKDKKEWNLENVQFGTANDHNQRFQIQVLLFSSSDIDDGVQIEAAKTIDIEAGTPLKNSIFRKLRNRQQIKSNVITVIRR